MKTEYKELKISRETAERWYNGCDKELKGLALTAFPDLEQIKPVVGEWYWTKTGYLFRCNELSNVDLTCMALYFFYKGSYSTTRYSVSNNGITRIATEEEIFDAFDKEARKRGYYEKSFDCLELGKETKVFLIPLFDKNANRFWLTSGLAWKDGKWAEFVDDFKEGETLAFSNHEDFRRFAVAKLTKIESDGRFSSDKGYIYPFAKRIEYKLL